MKKSTLIVTVDKATIAKRTSRANFGTVSKGSVYKSEKDYDRKGKKAQKERNLLRKGEYEE